MIKTAKAVGRMLDVNLFFVVEIVVGLCWGFHINYIAIYLDTELKASKTFLGQKFAIFLGRRLLVLKIDYRDVFKCQRDRSNDRPCHRNICRQSFGTCEFRGARFAVLLHQIRLFLLPAVNTFIAPAGS